MVTTTTFLKPFKSKELVAKDKGAAAGTDEPEPDAAIGEGHRRSGPMVKRDSETLRLKPLEFTGLVRSRAKPRRIHARVLLEQVWGYRQAADKSLVNGQWGSGCWAKIEQGPRAPRHPS